MAGFLPGDIRDIVRSSIRAADALERIAAAQERLAASATPPALLPVGFPHRTSTRLVTPSDTVADPAGGLAYCPSCHRKVGVPHAIGCPALGTPER